MNIFKDTGKTQSALYRPDIDGLRAVAVLLVLFFHAGFDFFSGGYVGVDVFFVISGYLITGILVSGIEKNKYSFKTFILSRITRLYPALISTVIITIIIGFMLFTPSDYINLGKTAIYTIASISNFFFWMKAGYFDTSSETNPLLHTWSLSVEQQFYLIWPLVIVLAIRSSRKRALTTILIIGFISLCFSEAFVKIDPTSNYYMMPFRIFEFAAGGALALRKSSGGKTTIANNIGFLLGLALIVFSAITYGKATAFPGVHALVPTIGACFCILCGGNSRASCLVRNTPIVAIGIVSYSIYLVHWPVLVFYKYYIYRPITDLEKISLILVSIALGFASYVLIENRFRKINLAPLNKMSSSFSISVAFIVFSSLMIVNNNGVEARVNKYYKERISQAGEFHVNEYGGTGYRYGVPGFIGDKNTMPSAVFLGDSYARQYAFAADNYLKSIHKSMITSFQDGCYFSLEYAPIISGKPNIWCKKSSLDYALEQSKKLNLPVIISVHWAGYYSSVGDFKGNPINFKTHEEYISFVKESINELANIFKPNHVLFIGSQPGMIGNLDINSCISRPNFFPMTCTQYLTTHSDSNTFEIDMNKGISDTVQLIDNAKYFDVFKYVCNGGRCETMTSDGQFIYSDHAHLSKSGAKLIWPSLYRDLESYLH